jgi:hypothetical protein
VKILDQTVVCDPAATMALCLPSSSQKGINTTKYVDHFARHDA